MVVRTSTQGSRLLYRRRARPETGILQGSLLNPMKGSRLLSLAHTTPWRLPGVNLQRGKKDSSVFGEFKQSTRKPVLQGERDLKAIADEEAQKRISSLESELDALKRSQAAETESLKRAKRKLEAELQEVGKSKEVISLNNEDLQSNLKGLSFQLKELGSRERAFHAAKKERDARHERQLLIYQDRFRAEVEFYKDQVYKTLEANRETEEKFKALAERVKHEQALAAQEALDDDQKRRRAIQGRRNYETLQSTFKAFQVELSKIETQVARLSNTSSRQTSLYWSWATRSFTDFRRLCAAHPDSLATHREVLHSIEQYLHIQASQDPATGPLTTDLLDISTLHTAWRLQAHRAREVTRALRYKRQDARAFRFVDVADPFERVGNFESVMSRLQRYLPRETFPSADIDLRKIRTMLKPSILDLNDASDTVAQVLHSRWAIIAPPAEQMAFAESKQLFDASPQLRLYSAVNLVHRVCDQARIRSLMYGFKSYNSGAQFDKLAEAVLKYRYQQERLGKDSDVEHDKALAFIKVYKSRANRLVMMRPNRRPHFEDCSFLPDGIQTQQSSGVEVADSYRTAEISRRGSRLRPEKRLSFRDSDTKTIPQGRSVKSKLLSPQQLSARMVVSSAVSTSNDKTVPARKGTPVRNRSPSARRARRLVASKDTAHDSTASGIEPSSAYTQGPLFRPTQPMRSAHLANEQGAEEVGYHIPANVFRATKDAIDAGEDGYWSYTLFKSSSGTPVRVHYCTSKAAAETVASGFAGESLVGFDMEWEIGSQLGRNSIKDLVSVVQLASEDRVAVFHLAMFRGETADDLMPDALKSLLESESITKAGVNIGGDFTRLRRCLGVNGKGIFELSHLYKVVRYSEQDPELVNRMPARLDEQVQYAFGLPLLKGPVRISAWSCKLSNEQIDYAATDAYAGLRLFHEMDRRRKTMHPQPPLPAFYETGQQIILGNGLPPPKRAKERSLPTSTEASLGATAAIEGAADDEALEATDSSASEDVDTVFSTAISAESMGEEKMDLLPDARLTAVDEWVTGYCATRELSDQPVRYQAKTAALRAYALWHQHAMTVEEVAGVLRKPPLKAATVNSYILEAIAADRKLPVDAARLRVVFGGLPGFVAVRFKGLARALGAA